MRDTLLSYFLYAIVKVAFILEPNWFGTLLDIYVEALWRSFWSGHLNQCQYSGLKVVKRLTNDCSSGNFRIGMVVIQLNLTDNPEI